MKKLLELLRFDAYLLITQKKDRVDVIHKTSGNQLIEWLAHLIVNLTTGTEYKPLMVLNRIEKRIIEIQENRKANSFVENQALEELRNRHPIN